MQASSLSIHRDAIHRVPEILSELLEEEHLELREPAFVDGRQVDFELVDAKDRRWSLEVKALSSPAVVARAAEELQAAAHPRSIPVLVVPYMTRAGARAAAERGLNWIDLSGNAKIRGSNLYISREGRPNMFTRRGRPSSPFAQKSARVARTLLQDPDRWWRQKELAVETGLDDGHISRIVRRLDDELLLLRNNGEFRPREPDLLLDAWADAYRLDRNDSVVGHVTGGGIELGRELSSRLSAVDISHAFTGLPAAWLLDRYAQFRLNTIYVHGDPRDAAKAIKLRQNPRGANVQLIAPADVGSFAYGREIDRLPIVSPVQVYLDLLQLPERSAEAATHLREKGLLWAK